MNKDFAKKRRSRYSKRKPFESAFLMPSWAWMVSGLMLGVGLSGVVYWKQHQNKAPVDSDITISMEDTAGKIKAKTLAKRSASKTGEARFDFYTLLPNMAQETAELATTTVNSPPMPAKHSTLAKALVPAKEINSTNYIIQAGSFRQQRQAEELKAKLAMAGFQASVQTYRLGSRETWHRVYIGPFKSKELALASQQRLEHAQSLHSLILKNRV